MGINEILTTLTILIALAAILNETNREYILLKFSQSSWLFILKLFVLCHFLLAFDWLSERISFLNLFYFNGFPPANVWAYGFTLILLGYIVYKIFFGFYAELNLELVVKNYIRLLLKGEFGLLVNLIDQYHKKDLISYLKVKKSTLISYNDTLIINIIDASKDKENSENSIPTNDDSEQIFNKIPNENSLVLDIRLNYAKSIFEKIIIQEIFIEKVVSIDPYFFTEIISELSTLEVKQEDFVNKYLQILVSSKNYYFTKELQSIVSTNKNGEWIIPDNCLILNSLVSDINVVQINQVWRAIGEPAIRELEKEIEKPTSLLRKNKYSLDENSDWNFNMKVAIVFFDVIARKAICIGEFSSVWMFYYYRYFVEAILNNFNEFEENGVNRNSLNYSLLEQIFENLREWKDLIILSKKDFVANIVFETTIDCIWFTANCKYINIEDKKYLIGWQLEDLISTEHYKETLDFVERVVEFGIKSYLPTHEKYNFRNEDEIQNYKNVIYDVYNSLDNIKLRLNPVWNKRYQKFNEEVLMKF